MKAIGDAGDFACGCVMRRSFARRFASAAASPTRRVAIPPPQLGAAAGYTQLITPDGQVQRQPGSAVALPVTAADREVANGRRGQFPSDPRVDGVHVRVLTTPMQVGVGAFQVARPLDEVDRTLGRLGAILGGMTLAAGILAAGAGRLAVRGVMAPVRRLAETAQHVSSTRDLSQRIEADGQDEVSDLARQFNGMLDAHKPSPGG